MRIRLPRIFHRRPFGQLIERAAHETLGPQAGHNYLWQHTTQAMLKAQYQAPNVASVLDGPGGQPGDEVNLTNVFVIDDSAIDGPVDLIV